MSDTGGEGCSPWNREILVKIKLKSGKTGLKLALDPAPGFGRDVAPEHNRFFGFPIGYGLVVNFLLLATVTRCSTLYLTTALRIIKSHIIISTESDETDCGIQQLLIVL